MANNNQTQSLNTITEVQELSNESAASIQGGLTIYGAYLYDRHRSITPLVKAHSGIGRMVNSNDRVSKIVITSGTWDFWEHHDYQGERKTLKRGVHILTGFWDNRISSFKRRNN
jgi:hypothetical protein